MKADLGFDGESLGEQLTYIVRDFVQRSISRLSTRVDGFENTLRERSEQGEHMTSELIALKDRLTAIEAASGNEVRSFADALIAKFAQASHV